MKKLTIGLTLLLAGCTTFSSGPPAALSNEALCDHWARQPITSGQVNYRITVWDEIVSRKLFSDSVANDVRYGHLRIGMPRLAVLCTEGRPTRINRTVTANGAREQWVFESYMGRTLGSSFRFVYLDDGVVTAFQD